MLNCCIERKRARDVGKKTEGGREKNRPGADATGPSVGSVEVSPGKSWDSWSDSEDEFFECLSDTDEIKEAETERDKKTTNKSKAEGRLQPHGKLTLRNSSEPLYIPITQVSTHHLSVISHVT